MVDVPKSSGDTGVTSDSVVITAGGPATSSVADSSHGSDVASAVVTAPTVVVGPSGNPVWDVNLPQTFDSANYTEIPPSFCLRSPTLWGPDKARPIARGAPRIITAVMPLTVNQSIDQAMLLENFYDQTIRNGSLIFDMPSARPRIVAGVATYPVYPTRFLKEPAIYYVDGGDTWEAHLSLEILPTSPLIFGTPPFTWPATLPTALMIDNYIETFQMFVLRDGDQGKHLKAKIRRTHQYEARSISGVLELIVDETLNKDDVTVLDTFFLSTLAGGSRRFTWNSSRATLSSGRGGDFAESYDATYQQGSGGDFGTIGSALDGTSLAVVSAVFRFVQPPTYRNIGGPLWEADVSLEML